MTTDSKYKTLREAMEWVQETDPDILEYQQLHEALALLRQADYMLSRGEVVAYKQPAFAERLVKPVIEFLELLDEA